MSYGNAIPIRLKDSSDVTKGFQRLDSSDENFIAHKVGPALLQSDSDDHGALGVFQYDSTALNLGSLTNTRFTTAVGTGGDGSLTITTDTTTLFRTNRQSTVSISSQIGSTNHVHPASTDSDGKGRMVIAEMSDDNYNTFTDRVLGKIIDQDLIGSYKLATGSSSGGSQSGYTEVIPDFFGDTIRDSDSASTGINTLNYSIWQRSSGTTTPSAKRPIFFKRGDSDERPVPNVRFYMDSTAPHDSAGSLNPAFQFQRSDLLLRPVAGFLNATSSDSAGVNSHFSLAPDKKTLTKLFGQHRNDSAGGSRMSRFKTAYLRTDNTNLGSLYNLPISKFDSDITYFSRRSDSDTAGHAENLLRGVKIKTKRFSNVASYGGVADAVRSDSTVQNLKDSNGYHTFEILFDQNTKFRLRSYDSANHGNGMGAGFYQSEANGAWETRFPVEGANYLRVENGHTVLSSSTRTLVDAIKSANSGTLPDALGFSVKNTSNSLGALDSDEISLLVYRDFKGFQEMDSDTIVGAIGGRARLRTQFPDRVGNYVVLNANQGTPNDIGLSGTWVSKGVATDTRRVELDTGNYTRVSTRDFTHTFTRAFAGDYIGNRTSTYLQLRQSSYTTDFTDTFTIVRSSSFSEGFLGNFIGDFTRNSTSDFSRDFTRQVDYTRTSIGAVGTTYTGNIAYTGNYTGDFVGNYAGGSSSASEKYSTDVNDRYYWDVVLDQADNERLTIYWGNTIVYFITGDPGDGAAQATSTSNSLGGVTIDGNVYYRGTKQTGTTNGVPARYAVYRNVDDNFTRTSTRDSTRTSNVATDYVGNVATDFIGNYARLLSYTGEFTGDFTGNFARDFTRIAPASFTRNFAGDYVGNYQTTRASNYTRTSIYTGNTDYAGNYTGNYSRNFVGEYTRDKLTASRETNFARTIEYVNNLGFSSYGVQNYLGAGDPDGESYTGVDLFYGIETSYLGTPTYLGNYIGDYARTRVSTYARTSTRTRSSAFNYTRVLSFARDFVGDFTRTSTRTRTSTYLATEGFSRDFTGDYVGNFVGNFTRNFLGNYSREFTRTSTRTSIQEFVGNFTADYTGDYLGSIVGANAEVINTYTLYARKA